MVKANLRGLFPIGHGGAMSLRLVRVVQLHHHPPYFPTPKRTLGTIQEGSSLDSLISTRRVKMGVATA